MKAAAASLSAAAALLPCSDRSALLRTLAPSNSSRSSNSNSRNIRIADPALLAEAPVHRQQLASILRHRLPHRAELLIPTGAARPPRLPRLPPTMPMATCSRPTVLDLTVRQTVLDLTAASSVLLLPGLPTLSTMAPHHTTPLLRHQCSLLLRMVQLPLRLPPLLLVIPLPSHAWREIVPLQLAPSVAVSGRKSLLSRSRPMRRTVLVLTTSSTADHPCLRVKSFVVLLLTRDGSRNAAPKNLADLRRLRQSPTATTLRRLLTTYKTTR